MITVFSSVRCLIWTAETVLGYFAGLCYSKRNFGSYSVAEQFAAFEPPQP